MPDCELCESAAASISCASCDAGGVGRSFCIECSKQLHSSAKGQLHALTDLDGKPLTPASTGNKLTAAASLLAASLPVPAQPAQATSQPPLSGVHTVASIPNCSLCEDEPSTLQCHTCSASYCSDCSTDFHRPAKQAGHSIVRLVLAGSVDASAPSTERSASPPAHRSTLSVPGLGGGGGSGGGGGGGGHLRSMSTIAPPGTTNLLRSPMLGATAGPALPPASQPLSAGGRSLSISSAKGLQMPRLSLSMFPRSNSSAAASPAIAPLSSPLLKITTPVFGSTTAGASALRSPQPQPTPNLLPSASLLLRGMEPLTPIAGSNASAFSFSSASAASSSGRVMCTICEADPASVQCAPCGNECYCADCDLDVHSAPAKVAHVRSKIEPPTASANPPPASALTPSPPSSARGSVFGRLLHQLPPQPQSAESAATPSITHASPPSSSLPSPTLVPPSPSSAPTSANATLTARSPSPSSGSLLALRRPASILTTPPPQNQSEMQPHPPSSQPAPVAAAGVAAAAGAAAGSSFDRKNSSVRSEPTLSVVAESPSASPTPSPSATQRSLVVESAEQLKAAQVQAQATTAPAIVPAVQRAPALSRPGFPTPAPLTTAFSVASTISSTSSASPSPLTLPQPLASVSAISSAAPTAAASSSSSSSFPPSASSFPASAAPASSSKPAAVSSPSPSLDLDESDFELKDEDFALADLPPDYPLASMMHGSSKRASLNKDQDPQATKEEEQKQASDSAKPSESSVLAQLSPATVARRVEEKRHAERHAHSHSGSSTSPSPRGRHRRRRSLSRSRSPSRSRVSRSRERDRMRSPLRAHKRTESRSPAFRAPLPLSASRSPLRHARSSSHPRSRSRSPARATSRSPSRSNAHTPASRTPRSRTRSPSPSSFSARAHSRTPSPARSPTRSLRRVRWPAEHVEQRSRNPSRDTRVQEWVSRSRSRSRSHSHSRSRSRSPTRQHASHRRHSLSRRVESRSPSRASSHERYESRDERAPKHAHHSRERSVDSRRSRRSHSSHQHERTPSPAPRRHREQNGSDSEAHSASRSRHREESTSRPTRVRSRSHSRARAAADRATSLGRGADATVEPEQSQEPSLMSQLMSALQRHGHQAVHPAEALLHIAQLATAAAMEQEQDESEAEREEEREEKEERSEHAHQSSHHMHSPRRAHGPQVHARSRSFASPSPPLRAKSLHTPSSAQRRAARDARLRQAAVMGWMHAGGTNQPPLSAPLYAFSPSSPPPRSPHVPHAAAFLSAQHAMNGVANGMRPTPPLSPSPATTIHGFSPSHPHAAQLYSAAYAASAMRAPVSPYAHLMPTPPPGSALSPSPPPSSLPLSPQQQQQQALSPFVRHPSASTAAAAAAGAAAGAAAAQYAAALSRATAAAAASASPSSESVAPGVSEKLMSPLAPQPPLSPPPPSATAASPSPSASTSAPASVHALAVAAAAAAYNHVLSRQFGSPPTATAGASSGVAPSLAPMPPPSSSLLAAASAGVASPPSAAGLAPGAMRPVPPSRMQHAPALHSSLAPFPALALPNASNPYLAALYARGAHG